MSTARDLDGPLPLATADPLPDPTQQVRRPLRDVLVCRDCCCGSTTKHPDVDHDDQGAALEAAAGPGVRVRVVACLDECERSNVVVVRDLRRPRRDRDTWLGDVLGDRPTAHLAAWLRADGELPPALQRHVFEREQP